MKPSEIIAIILIAAVLFIVVLVFSTIYTYITEGELQPVQIVLAVVVAIVAGLVAALRSQIKKAERLARKRLEK